MTILLDIDGVLVTTPVWRKPELHSDGFLKFNETAANNLIRILDVTKAAVVLTTTHRINYSINEWMEIFRVRGIYPSSITKLNELTAISQMADRATEIKEWIDKQPDRKPYVIIDDDLSINSLSISIRENCVLTKPMIGLDEEAAEKALEILLKKP